MRPPFKMAGLWHIFIASSYVGSHVQIPYCILSIILSNLEASYRQNYAVKTLNYLFFVFLCLLSCLPVVCIVCLFLPFSICNGSFYRTSNMMFYSAPYKIFHFHFVILLPFFVLFYAFIVQAATRVLYVHITSI